MDLDTITVDDFKNQFPKGFPYLPVYDSTALYNTGDRVYYETTELFYDCIVDGTTNITPDTVANWVKVDDDVENYVTDEDIERAFAEAQISFNQSLVCDATDDNIQLVYLYLTAHYLVHDIRANSQGLASSGGQLVTSRSAGSISESYAIPEAYTKNPMLTFYTTSSYGLKYLNIIYPCMVGNVGIAYGATTP